VITRTERTATYAIAVAFAVLALAPLVGVLFAAFHPAGSLLSGIAVPHSLSFSTFGSAWHRGSFATLMLSSLIVAASVVVGTVILAVPAGFAFGTMRFPFSNVFFFLFLSGLVVPFEALIVPLYYHFRDLNLTNTYWALILPQTGLSLSFGVFWMRAFFRATPRSLVEAARIDGASSWTTMTRVLLPLGRPAILTMVLLVFMWTWNEFLLALVMISDEAHRTAPLGLSVFKSRYGIDVPSVSAAATLVALPVLVVYVFLQRHFIRGVLSGALKT
jgi:raffinose/stachyose/melibiose transport system permease protein